MTPDISAIATSVAEELCDMGLDCIVTVSDGDRIAVNFAFESDESLAEMQKCAGVSMAMAGRIN